MDSSSPKSVDQALKSRKLAEVVTAKFLQGGPDMSVQEAIGSMQEFRSGYVVIAEGKKCVGIFTENDVIFKIMGKDIDWDDPVSKYMTPDPAVLHPEDTVAAAIDLMGSRRFYHIPLINEKDELINVLSVRTLIRFLAELYPGEILNLPPRPSQITESREGG